MKKEITINRNYMMQVKALRQSGEFNKVREIGFVDYAHEGLDALPRQGDVMMVGEQYFKIKCLTSADR